MDTPEKRKERQRKEKLDHEHILNLEARHGLEQLKEKKKKLPFGLYIVNAVQEEIGLRGAEMISRRIKPDVAIITDVCHDTQTPMYEKKTQGDLTSGKGPVLTYGPAVQNNLLDMIVDVASTKKIPFQRAAATRAT